MFVAVFRWDDSIEPAAWVTTADSINLDLVARLRLHEHNLLNGTSTWGMKADLPGGDSYTLAMGAPTREDVLSLVGLMVDDCGGRWPRPTQQVLHGEEPGVN